MLIHIPDIKHTHTHTPDIKHTPHVRNTYTIATHHTTVLIYSLSAALVALYAPGVPSTTMERLITGGFGTAAADYFIRNAPSPPIECALPFYDELFIQSCVSCVV